MEIQVDKTEKGHFIVKIQTDDKEIIGYLVSKDELYDILHRLPDIYSILRNMEHLADDILSDVNYLSAVKFMREQKKTPCRVLIRNQGFYCLEPINL